MLLKWKLFHDIQTDVITHRFKSGRPHLQMAILVALNLQNNKICWSRWVVVWIIVSLGQGLWNSVVLFFDEWRLALKPFSNKTLSNTSPIRLPMLTVWLNVKIWQRVLFVNVRPLMLDDCLLHLSIHGNPSLIRMCDTLVNGKWNQLYNVISVHPFHILAI